MIGKKIRPGSGSWTGTPTGPCSFPWTTRVTVGPIPGLIQIPPAANLIAEGGANAAIVHRGAAMFGHRGYGKDLGLILHLSASTHPRPRLQPESAGGHCRGRPADGGRRRLHPREPRRRGRGRGMPARTSAPWSSACQRWGMPLLGHDLHPRAEDTERVRRQIRPPCRAGGSGNGSRHRQGPYTGSPRRSGRSRRGAPPPS